MKYQEIGVTENKAEVHHIWDFKDNGVASAIHLILIDEKVKH